MLKSITLALPLLLALAPGAPAERPGRLELRTERVIVFKDGHALFIKKGLATTNERGEIWTDQVPDSAVLGSFWATPTQGRMRSMTVGRVLDSEVVQREEPCSSARSLLAANPGREVRLTLQGGESVSGRLQPSPPGGAWRPESESPVNSLQGEDLSGWAFLTGAEGEVAVPPNSVVRVEGQDLESTCRTRTRVRTNRKRMTMRFEKAGARREVRILYFTPGLRWIPSYRADLLEPSGEGRRVSLSLQAELLNEVEDLNEVPIDLVVGVPHLRFGDSISPLSLESALRDALRHAAPELSQQRVLDARYLSNSAVSSHASGLPALPLGLESDSELAGAGELFLHSLEPLTLLKGHRAALPLFTRTVPVRERHVWTLDLSDAKQRSPALIGGGLSPLAVQITEVWQELEFENSTGMPWTTGPLLVMEGSVPLGQDLLVYTHPGGSARMPVTKSTAIRGSWNETELSRAPADRSVGPGSWTRIDNEVRLVLSNAKRESVELGVTLRILGHLDDASVPGLVTTRRPDPRLGRTPDPLTEVEWTVDLPPGETVTRTVTTHRHQS